MTRIFVENQELDINAEITAQLNFAVDDLVNLDSKTASYSKTIVIPGSVRNNQIFGNIFEFTNSNFPTDTNPNVYYNFNASKSAQARIEINGLPAMKGIIRMMSIVIDRGIIEYEIVLFSELGGFVAAMGNKKLEDLDFSEYNLPWSVLRISNSWDNYNTGKGVVFPLIDYGNVSTDKHDYKFNAFRPALFVKEYLTKIIDAAGYTYDALFLEDSFFKRLIIPNNDKELLNKEATTYITAENTGLTEDTGFNQGISTIDLYYATNTTAAQFTASGSPVDKFTYTDSETRNISVSLKVSGYYEQEWRKHTPPPLGTSYPYGGSFSKLSLLKNGEVVKSIDLPVGNTITKLYQGDIDVTLNTTLDLIQDDELTFEIKTYNGFSNYYDTRVELQSALINLSVIPNPATNVPYGYGDLLKINFLIPKNVFQRDFFTSIMKMFNLMIVESKTKYKHITIIPNVDFYDLNNILDWSDKINRNKPIKIKPMSEINARYYDFNYKGDNDYYNELYKKRWNEGYGDRQYDNGMEFATQNKKVEIIFSSSVLVGYEGEDKVVPTICKIDNKGTIDEKEEAIAHNIRIMQCKKIEGVSEYDILDASGTTLSSYTDYLYAGHFNDPDNVTSDLNFGATRELFYELTTGALQNNVFNAFYSTYMAEITDKDSRLVSAEIYLDEVEIYNLDFRKLIFFDGALYRLYKITDWSVGELCKVDLLRVINTTYDSNNIHYGYVQIGNQIWAKENLNVDKFRNGDSIPLVTNDTIWSESTAAARCYYDNSTQDVGIYGQLYNWFAANDSRNIAPQGWRVPTKDDFEELISYVGSSNGNKLKSINYWDTTYYTGTDDYGFSARAAGYRLGIDGGFYQKLENCYMWAINQFNSTNAYELFLRYDDYTVEVSNDKKENGFSIRCIIE